VVKLQTVGRCPKGTWKVPTIGIPSWWHSLGRLKSRLEKEKETCTTSISRSRRRSTRRRREPGREMTRRCDSVRASSTTESASASAGSWWKKTTSTPRARSPAVVSRE